MTNPVFTQDTLFSFTDTQYNLGDHGVSIGGSYTFELWVYYDQDLSTVSGHEAKLFKLGTQSTKKVELHLYPDGTMRTTWKNDAATNFDFTNTIGASGGPIQEKAWHHVCFTYDAATGKVRHYLDFQEWGTATITASHAWTAQPSDTLQARFGQLGSGVTGKARDIRVYDYARVPYRVWNVSRLTNPIGMFNGATAFNDDISGWSTGSIVNMREMFKDASSFSAPIGSWDVADVWNFTDVFDGATAIHNPNKSVANQTATATAAQASINDSSSSWASNPNWSAPW